MKQIQRKDAENAKAQSHTPGPWKVAGSCTIGESPNGKFFHVAHVTLADDFHRTPGIADVSNRDRFGSRKDAHSPGPEQLANARLIAAAPELLAAVQDLEAAATKMLAGGFNGRMAEMHTAIGCTTEQARVAIAKAKGGAL